MEEQPITREMLTGEVPISVGRIVHYMFSESDAVEVNRRRTTRQIVERLMPGQEWPEGAQAHIGNQHHAGDVLPLLVVRVNDPATGSVNGQVFLDGNDTFWATSRVEGSAPGEWSWSPRA